MDGIGLKLRQPHPTQVPYLLINSLVPVALIFIVSSQLLTGFICLSLSSFLKWIVWLLICVFYYLLLKKFIAVDLVMLFGASYTNSLYFHFKLFKRLFCSLFYLFSFFIYFYWPGILLYYFWLCAKLTPGSAPRCGAGYWNQVSHM